MHKRLVTSITIPALFAVCGLLAACCVQIASVGGNLTGGNLSGSGKLATRDYAIDGFTGIEAKSGFDVSVTGGDAYRVSVTTDDNLLDAIVVKKVGDTLQLGVDSSKAQSVHTTRLQASITLPELKTVSLDSGSRLAVVRPAPRGTALKLTQRAGSHSDLSAMPVRTADVALYAGSSADINVTDKLDYQLYAGSQLRFAGNPAIGTSKAADGSTATQR